MSGPEYRKGQFIYPEKQPGVILGELPNNLPQLASLKLGGLSVQLQPGNGHQGLLGAGLPVLKRLRLDGCSLLDGEQGLAAALTLLPALQRLTVRFLTTSGAEPLSSTWTTGLQQLQHLQHVSLLGCLGRANNLQHLQCLTQLQSLELHSQGEVTIEATMFAGMQFLTSLRLGWRAPFNFCSHR
jgi:hypothetical protein